MLHPHLNIALSSSRELPGEGLQGPSGREGGSLNVPSFGSSSFQESQLLEKAEKKVTYPIFLTLSLGGSIQVQPAWSKDIERLRLSSTLRATGPDSAGSAFPDWVH